MLFKILMRKKRKSVSKKKINKIRRSVDLVKDERLNVSTIIRYILNLLQKWKRRSPWT